MNEGETLLFFTLIVACCITFYKVYFRNSEIALRRAERESRERVTMEKLEIMRAAIEMGYKEEDLSKLDSRLITLIGRENFDGIEVDVRSGDLADDLARVIRMHRSRSFRLE